MNENNKNINTISDEWFKATIDRNQLKKQIPIMAHE